MFTEREEGTALGLVIGSEVYPFRPTDGAKQDGVSVFASFDCFFREWATFCINSGATNEALLGAYCEVEAVRCGLQHFERLLHNFRADSVAREDGDAVVAVHARGLAKH